MATNFDEQLIEVLKKDLRFLNEDDDSLNRNEIINCTLKADKELVGLLIEDKIIREAFFDKIKDFWVFNINKFVDYVGKVKILDNSYTKFKNKIGLNVSGKYLNERGEVALVWPFKDCVLEGGMTKEGQKRNEIFFNEILAKDEIDRLLDSKVLTNFKKYTAKGEEKVKDFKRENGTIKDNLVIKGNNLLALHSLKKEFAGKVKLIYIDPPYNKDADSFYNDNFKRSSWLTFMKNRLEIAKKLLKEDGVIFVQIDDKQQAYLKIIMDEIFKEENFINCISVKMSSPEGVKMAHASKKLPRLKEHILFYKRENEIKIKIDKVPKNSWDNEYKTILERVDRDNMNLLKEIRENEDRSLDEIKLCKEILSKVKTKNIAEYLKDFKTDEEKHTFLHENAWRIIRTSAIQKTGKKLADEEKKKTKYKFSLIITPKKKMYFIKTDYDSSAKDPRIRLIFAEDYLDVNPGDFWQDIATSGLAAEGNVTLEKGKKPEKLIWRIINMLSNKGDIVLDYHLGSGTTCAVAHKIGRQYIGIEQLDYGEDDSVVRLKNVIKGDQSGISKAVNWKDGGEFIYCELLKYNEEAIDKIQEAKDTKILLKIWKEMCEKYFLNYDVDIKKFNDSKINFEKLSIHEQKILLLEMLNKNQLYVNLSEIDDSQFKVSKEDKELNKKFYGGK